MDADAMGLLSLLGTQQMQETPQLALCHHLGLQRYCEGSLGMANVRDLWDLWRETSP